MHSILLLRRRALLPGLLGWAIGALTVGALCLGCAEVEDQTCDGGACGADQGMARQLCENPPCPDLTFDASVAACTDECVPGEARCRGPGVSRCARSAEGCGEWSEPTSCGETAACSGGRCESRCAVSCEAGERQCASLGEFIECGVQGGCPVWLDPQPCGEDERCSGGRCIPQNAACEDACVAQTIGCLNNTTQRVCAQAGECTEWSAPQPCPAGQECRPGEGCRPDCPGLCEMGQARCEAGALRTCAVGADGCLAFGPPRPCPDGQTCAGDACVQACEDACVEGMRRCAGAAVEVCLQDGPCTRWISRGPCPDGARCTGEGSCGACQPGETEEEPCGHCGTRQRTCSPDGQWGDFGACGGGGGCRPGATEACGNCGTRTCDNACQWGACEGAGPCAPDATRMCGECGEQTCTAQCQWPEECSNFDGRRWEACADCGWRFCCPGGDWCPCAGRFPEECNGQSCGDDGVCR